MKFLVSLFPFMPEKKETTKFIIALIFYPLVLLFGVPIVTVVLGVTIIFAVLIPVIIPLLVLYSMVGFLFAILNFAGAMNFSKYKHKKSTHND